jgi:hypothetical protein
MPKLAIALLLSTVLCSAATITYGVDQTVGIGSVTGFIETDGTIGVLGAGNILNWNLLLNDGSTTFDLLGPLSGSNSQFGVSGSDLSATATEMVFNFSGAGWAMFQAPTLFSGFDLWCTQGTIQCTSSTGTGEVLTTSGANQFTALSGMQVIATVPEPSTLSLLGLGMTVMVLWKVRTADRRAAPSAEKRSRLPSALRRAHSV